MSDINVQSFSGKVKVSNDLTVTTNVHADYFKGNGSLLTNLPSGSGGVWNTNSDNEIYFISSNVGISNADPGHNLSVGSNLYVDDDGSNVIVVTGNVKADYFVGDGSLLTGLSGSGGVWSTNAANEIYFINNNVGISNADPGHNLSVGSNLYVDDDGLDVLNITGNVNATYLKGDGSLLTNLPSGSGGVWSTNAENEIYFINNNVGISNADPGHNLSVGSNLFVDDDGINVLVVDGNVAAESMIIGGISIAPSYPLSSVTDTGNTTPHTIEFTNVTTGIVTTGNVVVAGNVTASSFLGDGSGLTALNATTITTGTLADARIPNLNTSKLTAGTLPVARGGTGTTTSTGTGGVVLSTAPAFTGDVTFDTDTLKIDSTNNRVGIGTTDPSNSLHMYKAATEATSGLFIEKASGDAGTAAALLFGTSAPSETNNVGIAKGGIFFERTATNGRGDLQFCVDNVDNTTPIALSHSKMTIQSDGNVGIGTTSPGAKLHVNENVDNVGISIQNNARKYTVGVRGDTSDVFSIVDDTAGAFRAVIDSSGNVGIGTASPGAKLDVNGVVILTGGGHGSRPANDGGVLANAEIRGGPGLGSAGFLRLSGGGYNNGSASDATSKSFIDLCGYSGTTDFDRNISFHTLNQERMRINLSGYVGIGTDSPQGALHVAGSSGSSNTSKALGIHMGVLSGGGESYAHMEIVCNNSNSGWIDFKNANTSGNGDFEERIRGGDGNLAFYTNKAERMTINASGRVQFSYTEKFNLFYAPAAWGYSTTSTTDTNLWTFTVAIPQEGYLIVNTNGHWNHSVAGYYMYAKIGVDSNDPTDTSGFYDSHTIGSAGTHGGDFHSYKDSSVAWQDFNWSGVLKVAAGTRTICMRAMTQGGTTYINGAAVSMLYIPKNYF